MRYGSCPVQSYKPARRMQLYHKRTGRTSGFPPEPLGPSVLLLSSATYRLLQRQMRASGDLVEIAACLGRSDHCVNGFEVSRGEFRPQVFARHRGNVEMCFQTGLCLIYPGEEFEQ